jgi:hypothetical protein
MTLPESLVYRPGFLTEAGERDVLAVLATFELYPYVLHDTPSRRLVRSFGRALVVGAYDAGPAAPIPASVGLRSARIRRISHRAPDTVRYCRYSGLRPSAPVSRLPRGVQRPREGPGDRRSPIKVSQ